MKLRRRPTELERQLRDADVTIYAFGEEIDRLRQRVAELEGLLLADRETFTDPKRLREANAMLARAFGDKR